MEDKVEILEARVHELEDELKRVRLYAQMYKREMERIDKEYQNLRTKLSAFVEGIGA